ncbi:MAG: hypothetical protein D6732_10870, partial [Methanobacteriota archaeon]
VKIFAIVAFFASALLGEASGWLVRFVHPLFAWLKMASFITLELSMGFIIWQLLKMIGLGQNSIPYKNGTGHHSPELSKQRKPDISEKETR